MQYDDRSTACKDMIDRMFFEKFEDTVREDETIARAVASGQWDRVIEGTVRRFQGSAAAGGNLFLRPALWNQP